VGSRLSRGLLQAVIASAAVTAGSVPASARADSVGPVPPAAKPSSVGPAPASAKANPVGHTVAHAAPKSDDGPPPANVTLTIDASTPRGPWKMRVTNEGDVPVTIVADARLLALDVTPRSARKAEHCELPGEMRPSDDLARPLVLPPKRTYAEPFEPRLYCLEGRRLDALAPGAIVTATLGWSGHGARPPLLVSPIEGLESHVGPSKSIKSLPVALPDEPTSTLAPPRDEAGPASRDEPTLALESARSVDAASPSDIAIPITLVNKGHRATIVRFRPETLGFEVVGPKGAEHCSWAALPSAPTRDLFATLGPGTATTLTIVLSAYCPARALEKSGLYVVRASLDTRKASGAEIGIRSFDGQVIATAPTIVRLRRGSGTEPLVRPALERVP
jgi:hypothetical protein